MVRRSDSLARATRIDRVDTFGRRREHRTDDGVRTLCGLSLSSSNTRRPNQGLRCARCVHLDARPRLEMVVSRSPPAAEVVLVVQCLAASIAELDGDRERADRLSGAAEAPVDAIIATVMKLGEASSDVSSTRLCAMAAQVLLGTRTLVDLRSLCDEALRTGP